MTRVFLDTNIYVYALDRAEPAKQEVAEAVIEQAIAERALITGYQIVQEFLQVATTKFRKRMLPDEAQKYVDTVLWPWCEVYPSPALYATALSIFEGTGWAFFDSLVVAAALEAGCETLYSEDLQSGRKIRGLEIRNPFA